MRNAEYWRKRAEAVANIQHNKADRFNGSALLREYNKARRSVQEDVERFYARTAVNNEINLTEARKLLTDRQLSDFKMTLEEFTEIAKNNPDGRWTRKLNNAYYRIRMSRLEALEIQLEASIQAVSMAQNTRLTGLLTDAYEDSYYQSIYEIQKGIGVGSAVNRLNDVERIVSRPYLEQSFSQRIWGDNRRLTRQLQTEITQAVIRGDSIDRTSRVIAERMGVGYRNAQRLVRTEMAHIQTESAYNAYRDSGVVLKYEYLATLDEKTCSICGPMDGQVFSFAEKEEGVNIGPLHPNCRCDIVPHFDDEPATDRRIARLDGETFHLPANMTYNQWYDKYVA